MAIMFNQPVLHDRLQFIPGVSVAIPGAEHYFVAAGWASETDKPPVFTYEGVTYDTSTVISETGQHVLPEEAPSESENLNG